MKKTTKQNILTAISIVFMLVCLAAAIVSVILSIYKPSKSMPVYVDTPTTAGVSTSASEAPSTPFAPDFLNGQGQPFTPLYRYDSPYIYSFASFVSIAAPSGTLPSLSYPFLFNFSIGYDNNTFYFVGNSRSYLFYNISDSDGSLYFGSLNNGTGTSFIPYLVGGSSDSSIDFSVIDDTIPYPRIYSVRVDLLGIAPGTVFNGITHYSLSYVQDIEFTVYSPSVRKFTMPAIKLSVYAYGRGWGEYEVLNIYLAYEGGYQSLIVSSDYYTEYGLTYLQDIAPSDAYNDGYKIGYGLGVSEGKRTGKTEGYAEGVNYGEEIGFNAGYSAGIASKTDYSFLSLIAAVMDAPIKAFTGLLDFDVLGFNMAGFCLSLLTICIIIKIASIILGNLPSGGK